MLYVYQTHFIAVFCGALTELKVIWSCYLNILCAKVLCVMWALRGFLNVNPDHKSKEVLFTLDRKIFLWFFVDIRRERQIACSSIESTRTNEAEAPR